MTASVVRPTGVVTRGTTAPRRLRRVDRWMCAAYPRLVGTPGLLAVDVGFGSSPVTTVELARRLRRHNRSARVVGLEICRERLALAASTPAEEVELGHGGFELAGHRPHLVRVFNVLRQYDEDEVRDAWRQMQSRLAPGGRLVEGTSDESGRLAGWVTVDVDGPRWLTLALDSHQPPSAVAARLPKALIHHNVPGQPIHRLLSDLDASWWAHSPLRAYGHRHRLAATVRTVRGLGWPVLDGPGQWTRGLLTVSWGAVRPAGR